MDEYGAIDFILSYEDKVPLLAGTSSLRDLYQYVRGFFRCVSLFCPQSKFDFLAEFQEFIEEEYDVEFPYKNWATLISEHTEKDICASNEFYRLLKVYLAQRHPEFHRSSGK